MGAKTSVHRDWLRALQRVAEIEKDPRRTLPRAFDAVAEIRGAAEALADEGRRLSFDGFARRARRYARWAAASGLQKGDAVALVMENCADYAAIWLGLTRLGVVVSLPSPSLAAPALAHCLRVSGASRVIAAPSLVGACREAAEQIEASCEVLEQGEEGALGRALAALSDAPFGEAEESVVTLDDPALHIFTSGTTGLPKAAIVTHRRLLYWALWFSGLVDMGPQDRMYNCLPMHHSVGGVVAIFAPLMSGASVVLRKRFSASRFWEDVSAERCTLFQYIGELCRYLVNAPRDSAEGAHRLRLALGNGLRGEVWRPFQERFAIPRILEFYAATESNFSLYNVDGEPGAIGRIPGFLGRAAEIALVAFDEERGAPARGRDGRCRRVGVGEIGEAIARIEGRAGAFSGYVGRAETERKILHDVFEAGDAYMRSGDLMRRDDRGFFYFVDRIGDSFRWKGENVSTLEVERALARCPGVREVVVYGVAVSGHEGRAGMAALSVEPEFDLRNLRRCAETALPAYARPLFLRIGATLDATETFKPRKQALAAEGFDPARISEAIYFSSLGGEYAPLDEATHRRLRAGKLRL